MELDQSVGEANIPRGKSMKIGMEVGKCEKLWKYCRRGGSGGHGVAMLMDANH